jgi:hypothetical protein
MMRKLGIVAAAAAAIAAGAPPSGAQSLDQKRCVFGSALRLPAIPGLVITGSVASAGDKEEFAKRAATSFESPYRGAQSLNGTYMSVSVAGLQGIRDAQENGKVAAAIEALRQQVDAATVSSTKVELGVHAAGMDASFGFLCGLSKFGSVYSVPTGMTN